MSTAGSPAAANGTSAFALAATDMDAALAGWTRHSLPREGAEWQAFLQRERRKWRLKAARQKYLGWLPGIRRNQQTVFDQYDRFWAGGRELNPYQDFDRDSVRIEWRDRGYVAARGAIARVHHRMAEKAIAELQPREVLEVGCGNGYNLFALAARFPEISFSGIELTESGPKQAAAVAAQETFPASLREWTPLAQNDPQAHRRVRVRQGNAARLELPDNSVDMAMTVCALEQMEAVREAALKELARVARRWIVMIECFADFNDAPPRSDYVAAKRYFAAATRDLPRYGMRAIAVESDVPHKVRLGVGLVVAVPIEK